MEQKKKKKKPAAKESLLLHLFPASESLLDQRKGKESSTGEKQRKSCDKANQHFEETSSAAEPSVVKAVFVTHTEEISFDEFLKFRPRKID